MNPCFSLDSNPDPLTKTLTQKKIYSFTGADLAALVRSAATLAAEEGEDGAESVFARHFEEALRTARPSRRVGGVAGENGDGGGEAERVFASFSRPGLG